jgi:hypothetical protein
MKIPYNIYNAIDRIYRECESITSCVKEKKYGNFAFQYTIQSVTGMLRALRDNINCDFSKYDKDFGGNDVEDDMR